MNISPSNILKIYFLLIFLPYLYPQKYFEYEKVFTISEHIIFCLILYGVAYFSVKFGNVHAKQSRGVFFSRFSKPTKFLYRISRLMLLVSSFANLGIAAYVLFVGGIATSEEFDLVKAKNQEQGFAGFAFLSQLYLFFVPYYIWYSVKENIMSWKYFIIVLVSCVILRSIFYTERLAIIELIIFLLVTLTRLDIVTLTPRRIVISGALFLFFFMGSEVTRQFYAQYVNTSLNREIDWGLAFEWSTERYAAYYADTTNKLYLILRDELFYVNHNYLIPLQQIFSKFNIEIYNDTFRLQNYGALRGSIFKDFTNISGLGMIMLDFGYLGFTEFILLFYLLGYIYHYFEKGSDLVVFCIYPSFVIFTLEFARIFYFYETRIIIPLIIFFSILLVNYLRADKEPISTN